ncbi:unnamed protein product [Diamesa hyperborea]
MKQVVFIFLILGLIQAVLSAVVPATENDDTNIRTKRQCNILNSLSSIFKLGPTMTPYNNGYPIQYPGTYYDVRGQPTYTG